MNTQQVSLWVPIVVGIIGVIGIISGQLINAWREDRRWQREQGREDRRWQREQDREELHWKRDLQKEAQTRVESNRAHWRDKKFEVFTETLSFVRRWEDLIMTAARLINGQKNFQRNCGQVCCVSTMRLSTTCTR